jgi:hypothetical protein
LRFFLGCFFSDFPPLSLLATSHLQSSGFGRRPATPILEKNPAVAGAGHGGAKENV